MLRLIHSKWKVVGAATLIATSAAAQEIDLRFASARVSGTNFVMELAGIGDLSCVLEATEDFPASWIEVTLTQPLADGEIEVPVDRPQRFFRIRCGDDHSVNGAGYVARELTPGFQLIANPFDNGENTLAEVLGEAWPFGLTAYQFDAARQAHTATQFGRSEWLSDGQQLLPGAGAFIQVLAPSALVFGGLFDDSQTVAELAGGWNLVGSIAGATSAIVPEDGDRMVIFAGEVHWNYSFEFGEWKPAVPSTRLGEGFWYYRNRPGAVPPAGGCVLFTNFGPSVGGLGAPQFDPLGCRMEGTNWLAQLYAGPDEVSIAPVGEPVPFLSGQEEGFFNTGSDAVRYIESVAPGNLAVVQARMWSAWSGATFYETVANGGPYGITSHLSVMTGGTGDPPSLPAGLTGLTSSSLVGGIWASVSGGGSYFVGESAQLIATYDYVTSRTVTYHWQRGTPDQMYWDEAGNWIWIPGTWIEIAGVTGTVLELSSLGFEDADNYRFVAHIDGCGDATIESFPIELTVMPRPAFSSPSIDPATGAIRFMLTADSTLNVAVDYSADFVNWTLLRTVLKPVGPVEIIDTGVPGVRQRFYRARVYGRP